MFHGYDNDVHENKKKKETNERQWDDNVSFNLYIYDFLMTFSSTSELDDIKKKNFHDIWANEIFYRIIPVLIKSSVTIYRLYSLMVVHNHHEWFFTICKLPWDLFSR